MAEQNYYITHTENGDVCIAEDVIQRIITAAADEVEGVAGLVSGIGSDVADYLGVKAMPKGLRFVTDDDGVMTIDLVLLVRYGAKVAQVAEQVQQHVMASVEAITGKQAVVNVHVSGISFEKAEIK